MIFLEKAKTLNLDKKAVLYILFYAAATIATFVRTFVYAALLNPTSFGELNKLILYKNNFLLFASFGILLLAQKRLPIAYAQNNEPEIENLIVGSLLVFYTTSVLGFCLLLFLGVTKFISYQSVLLYCLLIFYSISQYVFLVLSTDLRSLLEREVYALLYAVRAVLILVATLCLYWVPETVTAALLISIETIVSLVIFIGVVIKKNKKLYFKTNVSLRRLKIWLTRSIREGMRLLFLSNAVVVMTSLDRWIGIFVLTDEEYGIYATGLIFLAAMDTIQVMINQYIFPLMSRTVGLEGYTAAYALTKKMTFLFLGLGFILFIPITVGIRIVVVLALPQYTESLNIIPIFVLMGIFAISNFSISFCSLCNLEKAISFIFSIYSALIFAFCMILNQFINYEPIHIAYIALLSSLLLWLTSYILGLRASEKYRNCKR
ncbi:MAG: hypothetical protein ACFB0E_20730 [Leptolyngbyaceae cyanobacterium]